MRDIASKLKRKLKPSDTEERCGLVLKSGKVISVKNAHPQPDKAFAISVRDMHKHCDELVATWHTHPGQSAALSQDDYMGFIQWPDIVHYIVGTDGVRTYKADNTGVIQELPCS